MVRERGKHQKDSWRDFGSHAFSSLVSAPSLHEKVARFPAAAKLGLQFERKQGLNAGEALHVRHMDSVEVSRAVNAFFPQIS